METIGRNIMQIFQDFDSLSVNLQIALDDLNNDDIFLPINRKKKMLILLEYFCDLSLTSIKDFLIHKKTYNLKSNLQVNHEDIPCTMTKIKKRLQTVLALLAENKKMSDGYKTEENIYYCRLFRLLQLIDKEVDFFNTQNDFSLFHTCHK